MAKASGPDSLSRRSFLKGAGGVAAVGVAGQALADVAQETSAAEVEHLSGAVPLKLEINGQARELTVEPRTTLLSALRDRLEPPLTGTKLVCDHGSCGACTVHVDGQPVLACMQLAVGAAGREITTVEGLTSGGELTPLQEAFCDKDALMCGFCTPGFLMALQPALDRNPAATDEELLEACSGNLCRCGTYPHIQDAARAARARGERLRGPDAAPAAPAAKQDHETGGGR